MILFFSYYEWHRLKFILTKKNESVFANLIVPKLSSANSENSLGSRWWERKRNEDQFSSPDEAQGFIETHSEERKPSSSRDP